MLLLLAGNSLTRKEIFVICDIWDLKGCLIPNYTKFHSIVNTLFNPFIARVHDGVCNVTLTFESVDEILWCDHSWNLSACTYTWCYLENRKFGNLVEICFWLNLAVKGIKHPIHTIRKKIRWIILGKKWIFLV